MSAAVLPCPRCPEGRPRATCAVCRGTGDATWRRPPTGEALQAARQAVTERPRPGITSAEPAPTSAAAALAVEPRTGTMRARVLEAIRAAPEGLTDEEGAERLRMAGNTYRPRRLELCQAGLVTCTGARRPTSSGLMAAVWGPAPAPRSGGTPHE